MSAQLASRLQPSGALQVDRMKLLAHDLNNPLTAIRILAELLHDQVQDEEIRQDVGDMIEAVDLAGALMDGVASLARLEGGDEVFSQLSVDLESLLRRCTERPALRRHVQLDLPLQLQLCGDSRALLRCFTDIFINARRLVNGAGRIMVRVEPGEDELEIRIRHASASIPPRLRGLLFERYGAVELRQQQIPVSAVGLVYARAVIEGHRGVMWFEDEGEGAMVLVVRLPR